MLVPAAGPARRCGRDRGVGVWPGLADRRPTLPFDDVARATSGRRGGCADLRPRPRMSGQPASRQNCRVRVAGAPVRGHGPPVVGSGAPARRRCYAGQAASEPCTARRALSAPVARTRVRVGPSGQSAPGGCRVRGRWRCSNAAGPRRCGALVAGISVEPDPRRTRTSVFAPGDGLSPRSLLRHRRVRGNSGYVSMTSENTTAG